MYKIIEKEGNIDKDLYNRKISPVVVNQFCIIAKQKRIDLDTITKKQFESIYKTYTENLIQIYENK